MAGPAWIIANSQIDPRPCQVSRSLHLQLSIRYRALLFPRFPPETDNGRTGCYNEVKKESTEASAKFGRDFNRGLSLQAVCISWHDFLFVSLPLLLFVFSLAIRSNVLLSARLLSSC